MISSRLAKRTFQSVCCFCQRVELKDLCQHSDPNLEHAMFSSLDFIYITLH